MGLDIYNRIVGGLHKLMFDEEVQGLFIAGVRWCSLESLSVLLMGQAYPSFEGSLSLVACFSHGLGTHTHTHTLNGHSFVHLISKKAYFGTWGGSLV